MIITDFNFFSGVIVLISIILLTQVGLWINFLSREKQKWTDKERSIFKQQNIWGIGLIAVWTALFLLGQFGSSFIILGFGFILLNIKYFHSGVGWSLWVPYRGKFTKFSFLVAIVIGILFLALGVGLIAH